MIITKEQIITDSLQLSVLVCWHLEVGIFVIACVFLFLWVLVQMQEIMLQVDLNPTSF